MATPGRGAAVPVGAARIVPPLIVPALVAAILAAGGGRAAEAPPAAQKLAVKRLFPAGGTAGHAVVVKAEGSFPRWPPRVWTDRPGTTWQPQAEPGTFQVTIAAEGALGVHRVRLHDDRDSGAVRRFVVGTGPEIEEREPDDLPQQPQEIAALPVTVNGVLDKAGDVDGFGVRLEAGRTLVATLDAHGGPGAPIDAVLDVVDERGGYLARNLDARGLDPRIVFVAPRTGRYVVRVWAFPAEPNSTIGLSGAADHVYRLELAAGSRLAATLPAAVAREGAAPLRPLGWNLPEAPGAALVSLPAGGPLAWVAFAGIEGVVPLPVVDSGPLPVLARGVQGPPLEPPLVASGCFSAADERLEQLVAARKGEPLLVAVEAGGHGSEAEAVLEILSAEGRSLLRKTDRDPPASWTPPADAAIRCVVRELRGGFGPGHFFRLRVLPATAAIEATGEADAVEGAIGGTIELPIAVERLRGWKPGVEIVLVDPPPGIVAEPVTSAVDGDTARKVRLVVKPTAPYSGPLRAAVRRLPADAPPGEIIAPVRFGKDKQPLLWVTVPPPVDAAGAAATR
jgi:hypothetical protein